jgi:hypothetical protein
MSITHGEAQYLIQRNMEDLLDPQELATLTAHLHGCRECTMYASEIRAVTELLVPVMKRQWNFQPAPLSITALMGRRERINSRTLLTMRTAAIGLMFVAFFFSAWQFVVSGAPVASQIPMGIAPLPTPSLPNTQSATETTSAMCEMLLYTVRRADTLASIAEQFSTSENEIVQLNGLKTEAVSPPMELMVPACHFTPTGTFYPVTFTTTYTPRLNVTTTTPDG